MDCLGHSKNGQITSDVLFRPLAKQLNSQPCAFVLLNVGSSKYIPHILGFSGYSQQT